MKTDITTISPHLVSWNVYDPAVKTNLTSNAILTPEGWWIVDPTPITEGSLNLLQSRSILGILLTNENHERATFELSKKLNCNIHSHEATLGLMEIHPDFFFRNKDQLKGGIEVIHLPGVGLGESCFYDTRNRILLMGDALINLQETGFTFLPDKYCKDPALAKKSMHCLLNLEIDILTFAHGSPITSQTKKKLEELLTGKIEAAK